MAFDTKEVINPSTLLGGYRVGVFPMASPAGEILWFSPDPRAILPLSEFHIPHGLKRRLNKDPYEIRINTAFDRVVRNCAKREETWIDATISSSYNALHHEGHAHSVECWLDGSLVGGLYGVAIGGAFFGESMFHHATDASKIALHFLVERLKERGFGLLDTQWNTPHLEQFGVREIPRQEYLECLENALGSDCDFV